MLILLLTLKNTREIQKKEKSLEEKKQNEKVILLAK